MLLRTIERKDKPALESKMRLSFGLTEVKFSSDTKPGYFTGYGAIFNIEDDGGDVILPGAFKATLAEWKAKNKLPKMLWQHGLGSDADNMLPVGYWESMVEDEKGLAVAGQLDPIDTERGRTLHAGMKNGSIDGLSITYVATDVTYGQREGEPWRTIKALDLYEVGPVLFGMNEDALIDEAKAASTIKTIRDFESFLRDVGGFSKADAKAIASGGFKAKPADRDDRGAASLSGIRERMQRLLSNT